MKGKKSVASAPMLDRHGRCSGPIRNVVFACDAGMGSSAMGASVLRKKIQAAGYGDVTVTNKSIANLTDTYDVVVTHQDLTDRARQRTGSAVHVSVDNFMNSPRYDEIVELVRASNGEGAEGGGGADEVADEGVDSDVLRDDAIVPQRHGRDSRTRRSPRPGGCWSRAVPSRRRTSTRCTSGRRSVSTHMGNLLAIPHGTNEAKSSIRRTAISFVRYPDGDRLERQAGRVRGRHRRRGQRPPRAAAAAGRGVRRRRAGRAPAPGDLGRRHPRGAQRGEGLSRPAGWDVRRSA